MLRVERALEAESEPRLAIGGGVAANRLLRERAAALGVPVHVPPRELCTDNAAMIATRRPLRPPAAVSGVPGARRVRDEARRVSAETPRRAAPRSGGASAPAAAAAAPPPSSASRRGRRRRHRRRRRARRAALGRRRADPSARPRRPPRSRTRCPTTGVRRCQPRGSEQRVLVQFSRPALGRPQARAVDGRRGAARRDRLAQARGDHDPFGAGGARHRAARRRRLLPRLERVRRHRAHAGPAEAQLARHRGADGPPRLPGDERARAA